MGALRALQHIDSVGIVEPFIIVPVVQTFGIYVGSAEHMAAEVRWAERAQYDLVIDR
jgi:hypothetical protein